MLLLYAAASFACLNPTHHDGDAIRCDGMGRAMRLHGIDAPEMPGACRPGRACVPGDPFAARDHLETLTRGHAIRCEQVDTDHYGRRVVECRADGVNIACEMIADGYAVERYGRPDCRVGSSDGAQIGSAAAVRARTASQAAADVPMSPRAKPAAGDAKAMAKTALAAPPMTKSPAPPIAPSIAVIWMIVINIFGFAAMAIDKRRAIAVLHSRVRRVPESSLLAIAMLGGSAGLLAARQLLRHKINKRAFGRRLVFIGLVQLGIMVGLLLVAR